MVENIRIKQIDLVKRKTGASYIKAGSADHCVQRIPFRIRHSGGVHAATGNCVYAVARRKTQFPANPFPPWRQIAAATENVPQQ
jgi:hypothetical protein